LNWWIGSESPWQPLVATSGFHDPFSARCDQQHGDHKLEVGAQENGFHTSGKL